MSKVKYHVNPFTGVPSICRAKKGNCPYGGASGYDYHYDTFQEAQAAAQEYMESNYGLLPVEEGFDAEIEEDPILDAEALARLPKASRIQLLEHTNNEDFLMSVIERSNDASDDWDNLKAVYNNPNLPRDFVERVAKMPNEYTKETQRFMAHSPSMTHEDLMSFIDNTADADALIIAYRNPNIDEEWMMSQIDGDVTRLTEPPLIGFLDNPNLPENVKAEFYLKVVKAEIKYPDRRDDVEFAKLVKGEVQK